MVTSLDGIRVTRPMLSSGTLEEWLSEAGLCLETMLDFVPSESGPSIRTELLRALDQGTLRISTNSVPEPFEGTALDYLSSPTRAFLQRWYENYRTAISAHAAQETSSEINNYRKIMWGALAGIAAGVAVGYGIDHLGKQGIGWEITARGVPAVLEATGILLPFAKNFYHRIRGTASETPTETWAIDQFRGPLEGIAMLALGEVTGLNEFPWYKATAVFWMNTGNNVIGAWSTFMRNFYYTAGEYTQHLGKRLQQEARVFTDLFTLEGRKRFDESIKAYWQDKFQSSNALVAGVWYISEHVLRGFGVVPEKLSNLGAAVESGLLSCDTAVAAKAAQVRYSSALRQRLEEITSDAYMRRLYHTSTS